MLQFRSRERSSPSLPAQAACGRPPAYRVTPLRYRSSQRSRSVAQRVAPFSAARVAPILRQPCAERSNTPAALQASLKAVAERLLAERLAARAANEGELANRAGIKRALQDGQDRNRHDHFALALLGAQRGNALAHMLASEPDGIAAP